MSKKKKAKIMAEKAGGKVKEDAGNAAGDSRLEAKGNVEQALADVKQAGEKVKDALKK